jgi:hypothetical protein
VRRAERDELRSFFTRTGSPRIETRTKPSPMDRLVELMNNRYPGGPPPVSKSGHDALLEIQARRWPHEPKSGQQALLETLARRWPEPPA